MMFNWCSYAANRNLVVSSLQRQYDVLSHLKESHPLSQSQRGVAGEPQLISQSQHVTLHATQSPSDDLESSQSQHDFVKEHDLSSESQRMRPTVSLHESQSQPSFVEALSRGIVSGEFKIGLTNGPC